MSAVLSLLPRVAPLAARHVAAYMELAAADAAVLARSLTRRLIAAAVALLGAIFSLLMGCVWIVTAVWDTPWRGATIAGLLLLFVALTIVGAVFAARRWPVGRQPFARLRGEWDSDQSLIRELSEPVGDADPVASADIRRQAEM
jgi:uncharacterized membrane protein YqjE